MSKAITRKSDVNWALVRQEYEGSLISGRALAEKYKVSPKAVSYHVQSKGWKRPDEFAQHAAILPAVGIKLKADGTQLTEVPIADDIEALAALRHRIIGQHKVDISRDAAYLNELEKAILEKKSQPIQKLNSLALIVKVRAQLIELERQAHAIAAGGASEKGQTNVQVNVTISPQDAYRQLIEGSGGL